MSNGKTNINVVMIGHHNHGKSTIAGQLLHLTGSIDQDTMNNIEEEAQNEGKETSKYAWIFDKLKAERERDITIDISFNKTETDNHNVTIIDTPGTRDYLKNTLTGISQADCALLVASCVEDEYDEGLSADGLTREHTILAFNMAVKQIVVVLNKMDSVNYSQKRFNEAAREIHMLVKKAGYNPYKVAYVPTCGYDGDNIAEASSNMPWYEGPTLLEAIDKTYPLKSTAEQPLRLPISDVQNIDGVGTVAVGRVQTGVLRQGMNVTFTPEGVTGEVGSIEKHHESVDEAHPGDIVGFSVNNININDIRRGCVASDPDKYPAKPAYTFTARIKVLRLRNIRVGYTPVVDCHTAHVPCKVVEFWLMDGRTGELFEHNPVDSPRAGNAVQVVFQPIKPMCVETFKEFASLGSITLRDIGQIVAIGKIIAVNKSGDS